LGGHGCGMDGPPRLDLRRRTRHPAAGLLRVTAAVAASSLPLVLVFAAWQPFGPGRCGGDVDSAGFPVPCTDVIEPYNAIFRAVVATGCLQVLAIGIYLVIALPRTTASTGAVLRWAPMSVAVIAMALSAFAGATHGALVPGFVLWLIAPLIFDRIHRADARSAVLLLLALLPSAVVSAIFVLESPFYALPAAMFLATGIFVGVRRATS
jgi:hypothetical protein